MTITNLFRSSRAQAVRFTWERFFESLVDLDVEFPDREQPVPQERDWAS